jgi:hypothetical protein
MEHRIFKNVNNYLKTNIDSYFATSGGQSSNLYLNVHFFNTRDNLKSVAAEDSCFPALVSNTCCSIKTVQAVLLHLRLNKLTILTFHLSGT